MRKVIQKNELCRKIFIKAPEDESQKLAFILFEIYFAFAFLAKKKNILKFIFSATSKQLEEKQSLTELTEFIVEIIRGMGGDERKKEMATVMESNAYLHQQIDKYIKTLKSKKVTYGYDKDKNPAIVIDDLFKDQNKIDNEKDNEKTKHKTLEEEIKPTPILPNEEIISQENKTVKQASKIFDDLLKTPDESRKKNLLTEKQNISNTLEAYLSFEEMFIGICIRGGSEHIDFLRGIM